MVGGDSFGIQDYRRNRLRPDFVAHRKLDSRPLHLVWVVESKGKQLKSNEDTNYKRDVARLFSDVGRQMTWQQLSDDFKDHQFCFHILDEAQEQGRDWKDELQSILAGSDAG